jgi:deoxycytidylate deaminase
MSANLAAVPKPIISDDSEMTARERIGRTLTPEIVIALCGPLGTPLHEVAKLFQEQLTGQDFKYSRVDVIRLSEEIRKLSQLPVEAGIESLINAGNDLRVKYGNAVLVQRAIQHITLARERRRETAASQPQVPLFASDTEDALVPAVAARVCHIIDSVKNLEELELLRSVYGDMLHVVGVYSPIELRIDRLGKKLSKPDEVHRLINRDSGEESDSGQRVQDTFPLADFFLRADAGTDSQLGNRVRRFLDLMLGTRIITPTVAERAMYAAHSAARNSACLSRQVGAAITSESGEIISTGWNDVPRAFGGLYEFFDLSSSTDDDHRCYNKDGGKCFNDEEKGLLAKAVVDKLVGSKVVPVQLAEQAYDVIRHDSQLKSLIEFSRAVHAEMHALLNAGANDGAKIKNGKLFVTTYPCHSCARHIIASGIREVYFVEPYRKSLATKLHADAITEQENSKGKVRIVPFDGVAPSRFLRFFGGEDRKDSKTGRMRTRVAHPVTAITLEAIHTLEGIAVRGLKSKGVGQE